jgi:hypothetical protein
MLYKLLSALFSLFASKRKGVLLCQDWTGAEARDTRMDSGAGGGAHHLVERRDLRQRNRSPAERYEKRGHRQSLSPSAAEAPAVISDAVGRPERRPTGATGSGNVQLAAGRDRRKRLLLLWLGGRPGETLLPYALQTGVPTGSQKPQGCCGRLILGRERKPDLSDIRPGRFHLSRSRRTPRSSTTAVSMPLRL